MTTGVTTRSINGDPAAPNPPCPVGAAPDQSNAEIPDADSWRKEVAARLERYRTRRKPRTPRYPSLLLPFDAPETWSRPTARTNSGAVLSSAPQEEPSTTETAPNIRAVDAHEASQTSEQSRRLEQITEQSAKVIEFPRSAAIPVFHP